MPAELKEVSALVKTLRLLTVQLKAATKRVEDKREEYLEKTDAWRDSDAGVEWDVYLNSAEALVQEVDDLYIDEYVDLSEFDHIK